MSKPDNSIILEIEDLNVDLATNGQSWRVLDRLSLSIAKGEILGLVGESGAGKSLTGAAIIRLLPRSAEIISGGIKVDGERIEGATEQRIRAIRGRDIGSVFQDPLTSLDPLFTIGQQLIETIRAHLDLSFDEAKKKAIGLLDEVGISASLRRFDQYPHELSGGMRQRVVIALALCADPKLLIADEPTTALDVSVQAQVLNLLKKLCTQRRMGMLLITHDMGVIAETAQRVAVLYAGRIVEEGPVHSVISAPVHPYTVGLVRSIPQIGVDLDRLPQINGSMPRRKPGEVGCAFRPRCFCTMNVCAQIQPELMLCGLGKVACFNPQLAGT